MNNRAEALAKTEAAIDAGKPAEALKLLLEMSRQDRIDESIAKQLDRSIRLNARRTTAINQMRVLIAKPGAVGPLSVEWVDAQLDAIQKITGEDDGN